MSRPVDDQAGSQPGHLDDDRGGVRLQKVLAAAGIGSRRACEVLIEERRVEVNGQVVLEQGLRVDPEAAVIRVDGMRVQTRSSAVYLVVNKPRGMVSTMSDPQGRPCLSDLVGTQREERLFHVGRLDAESEGLLLLTNDGELAHRLSHPSFGVNKTYLAEVSGTIARDVGRTLRSGIVLDDGLVAVDSFRVVGRARNKAMVEVVIHEGRKHIVRRMLAALDLPVQRLIRTQFGPVKLGYLRPGKTRALQRTELSELFAAAGL
jgi:23S rRNA pseudouridine2605 synthase